MRFLLRTFLLLLTLLLLSTAAVAVWALYWIDTPLEQPTLPLDFQVRSGVNLKTALAEMQAAGVNVPLLPTLLLARWQGDDKAIKAGSYVLEKSPTPKELLAKLTAGDVSQAEIRLIEGGTWRQWRAQIEAHPELNNDIHSLSEAQLAQQLQLPVPHLEGWLLPDTYRFDRHSKASSLIAHAVRLMRDHLAREWERRAADLPYKTPYEALILASIIEKETGYAPDRARVAAVFVNRLRVNMRLQTDPSVIYGMGDSFDGNLRKSDLTRDTPYNSYTRVGLPPTPIAMLSLASLSAALHPDDDPSFYFVAKGDGSSHFSQSLAEHNRAVNRYQRGGRSKRENKSP